MISRSCLLIFLVGLQGVFISACNNAGKLEIKNAASGNVSSPTINFAGISSINEISDTSLKLNWVVHTEAIAYEIYETTSGLSYLGSVSSPTNTFRITGLSPGTNYRYLVRARDIQGNPEQNLNHVLATTNLAPDVPSGLSLIRPANSPGVAPTATVRVSGVKNGDTIKLFTDNTCTTEVASGVATATTIDLTTSALLPASYTFYANAINTVPNASACSVVSLPYQKNDCPVGFIPVAPNPVVGTTTEFCVMKFEAKCLGASCPTATPGPTATAVSQAAGTPWTSIDQINAKLACTNKGAQYDLISNPEWMTIARDIEMNVLNWTGGSIGSGVLSRGHTDNSPASTLAVSNVNDPYAGTGNTAVQAVGSGREQKRTFILSNAESLWDFSGNVWEWVNWSLGAPLTTVAPNNKAYVGVENGPQTAYAEFTSLSVNISSGDQMEMITWRPTNPTFNSSHYIGRYIAGANNSGGAAFRGNDFDDGANAGIFSLNLNEDSTASYPDIGFRCVYRLP
jgi:hypothetical protein